MADAVELDPLVPGIPRLTGDAVVISPDGEQALPERCPIAAFERGELLVGALRRQVALGDHRRPRRDVVGLDQLGDRRAVHHLGIRRGARRTRMIGPSSLVPDAAGLGLAEVDVVDRGEPALQLGRKGAPAWRS